MVVAITALTQNSWPPRVAVALTGLTVSDQLDIYREVAGQRTLLRGGHVDAVDDTGYVRVDAELPFGTPVRYVAVVNEVDEYVTVATAYTLPGGKVALTDAITGAAAEVVILAAGDRVYASNSVRFQVAGRNLLVSDGLGDGEGAYELFLDSTAARDDLLALLKSATESIVQIRQPLTGTYDGVDAYLAVDKATERRWSQDGSDPRRVVTIEFAEVDGWAPELVARGFSYGEVATYYTGLTYADAAGDFATYLDAVQGDFS